MSRRLTAVLCLLEAAQAMPASAETQPASNFEVLKVSGNSRTKTDYIENLARRCLDDLPGDTAQAPSSLAQCLKNSRLFSEVTVTHHEPNTLLIQVEERWTLLAIPLVIANNSGRSSLGLFAAESNFLGRGKQAVLGGTYGQTGSSFMLLASDRAIAFSRWQGTFLGAKARRFYELHPRSTVVDAFNEEKTVASTSLGYNFPSQITPQLGLEYSHKTYSHHGSFSEPEELSEAKLNFQTRWAQKAYRLYFDSGYSIEVASSLQMWRSDERKKLLQITGGTQAGWNPFFDHALMMGCKVQYLHNADRRDALKLGGGPGMRGFATQTLWVERAASCFSDYQIPFHKSSIGTVTFAPLADAGWARTPAERDREISFSSMGGGVFLFLNQIAMPGMGMACHHTFHDGRWLCQFSLGAGGSWSE